METLNDDVLCHVFMRTEGLKQLKQVGHAIDDHGMRFLFGARLVSARWNTLICVRLLPSIECYDGNGHRDLDDTACGLLCNLRKLRMFSEVDCPWRYNTRLTTTGLMQLTRLVDLVVHPCAGIDYATALPTLSTLRCLALPSGEPHWLIDDATLGRLTGLQILILGAASRVTDAGLAPLTRLGQLGLAHNTQITGDALSRLTRLTYLDLSFNTRLDPRALLQLPNLRRLDIRGQTCVSNKHLLTLTQLRILHWAENPDIRLKVLLGLPLLEKTFLTAPVEVEADDDPPAIFDALQARGVKLYTPREEPVDVPAPVVPVVAPVQASKTGCAIQ